MKRVTGIVWQRRHVIATRASFPSDNVARVFRNA